MSFLVFDIETRVDKALLRATQFRGESISDEEAYSACASRSASSRTGAATSCR